MSPKYQTGSGELLRSGQHAGHLYGAPLTTARGRCTVSVQSVSNLPECHCALPLLLLNYRQYICTILRCVLLSRLEGRLAPLSAYASNIPAQTTQNGATSLRSAESGLCTLRYGACFALSNNPSPECVLPSRSLRAYSTARNCDAALHQRR